MSPDYRSTRQHGVEPASEWRWHTAQVAEHGFWAHEATSSVYIDATGESRRMQVDEELALFDHNGEFKRRIARARRVLEVGSGPIGIIHFLDTPALRVALDPLMLDLVSAGYANSFGAARVEGVGERLPISTGSIDIVICYNVLDHCLDPLGVMNEMYRVLRPGGTMVLELHLIRAVFGLFAGLLGRLDPPHPYHFTRDQALSLARTAGFRLEFERIRPKGFRRFPLKDLLSYNGLRHLGSSVVTGTAGTFRYVRD